MEKAIANALLEEKQNGQNGKNGCPHESTKENWYTIKKTNKSMTFLNKNDNVSAAD